MFFYSRGVVVVLVVQGDGARLIGAVMIAALLQAVVLLLMATAVQVARQLVPMWLFSP